MTSRLRVLLLLVGTAALAAPGVASASTISITRLPEGPIPTVPGGPDLFGQATTVEYAAAAGETNAVRVTVDSSGMVFTDPGATITAPECTVAPDAHSASCPGTTSLRDTVVVATGDGDDSASIDWPAGLDNIFDPSASILDGGSGDDALTGGGIRDSIDGGDGADDIHGGAGDDTLIGGVGADLLRGEDGRDTASYDDHSAGVEVTLDRVSNDGNAVDGAPVLRDNVASDVEDISGTAAVDRLVGDPRANRLSGGRAADALDGGAGDDVLAGGEGADDLAGGAGDDRLVPNAFVTVADGDTLSGGTGTDTADYSTLQVPVALSIDGVANDAGSDNIETDVENVLGGLAGDTISGSSAANVLVGGHGNDQITGGPGRDTLDGGANDDTLLSRDGEPDVVACGEGDDLALTDSIDARSGCERGFVPAVAPPPAAAADRTAPRVTVGLARAPKHIATLLHAGLRVAVRCSEPCTVRIDLRRGAPGGRLLGRTTRRLRRPGVAHLRIRVRRAERRRLAALRRTRLALRVVVADAAGNRRMVDRRLTLRR
jgi:Ca2+-binding RTX toxin-like protein